jgi:sterol desaturase/sphingolipid hydroxylase (fatty acid hydroxylase superfamily)
MEKLIPLLFPLTFILALIAERVFPARPLPQVRGWFLKGLLFFVLSGLVGGVVPAVFAELVRPYAPLHLDRLGIVLGGVLAFLAGDFLTYSVHRTMHRVPWLWRWTHQLHHSAERLDIAGANYFHPLDLLLQGGAGSVGVALLGVSPAAAVLASYIGFFAAMFQHLNVRTPRFIGYFLQRPEAHAIHHARGVHAYNYGNCTFWDMAFGTFRNPDGFAETQGFWDGASSHLGSMLVGRDVSAPPPTRRTTTVAANVAVRV